MLVKRCKVTGKAEEPLVNIVKTSKVPLFITEQKVIKEPLNKQ